MARRKGFHHPQSSQALGEPLRYGKRKTQAVLRRIAKGLVHLDPAVHGTGRDSLPTDPGCLMHEALGGRPLGPDEVNVTRLIQRLDTDPKDYLEAFSLIGETIPQTRDRIHPVEAYRRLKRCIDERREFLHLQETSRGDEAPNRRPAETHPRTQASPKQKSALLDESIQTQSVRRKTIKRRGFRYESAQIVEIREDENGVKTGVERLVFTLKPEALSGKGGITNVEGY